MPRIKGADRPQESPRNQGFLGVEGMSDHIIINALKAAKATPQKQGALITRARLYEDGLIGRKNSAEKRKQILNKMNLPDGISAKNMLLIINRLYTPEEYAMLTGE